MERHRRSDFVHHNQSAFTDLIREIVFGAEDGMVSTMGALTGIAVGTSNHSVVILAGFVVVCVESISMGMGTYLSNKSATEVSQRMLAEEAMELKAMPGEEREELAHFYQRDGWPKILAETMAQEASRDEKLFLREMSYRELKIIPDEHGSPVREGISMFISYVVGGAIPILPYLLLRSTVDAISTSVVITLIGLFMLGVLTTRFTRRIWYKAGAEMLLLAGAASVVGYIVGRVGELLMR